MTAYHEYTKITKQTNISLYKTRFVSFVCLRAFVMYRR
jgi:hypothetical protein